MQIALFGGTGDIGEGLAFRWAYHTDYEVIIGSRDPDKARAKAGKYETELSSRGCNVEVNDFTNKMVAGCTSVVVPAVPPCHVSDTVEAVSDSLSEGDVLVTPAAGMKRDDNGFHYRPPKAESVTVLVADAVLGNVLAVSVFHSLMVGRLADLDADLGTDTLLVADDEDAKEAARPLAEDIDGLRALDGGGLASAPEVGGATPLLTNIVRNNDGLHDLGIRFK